jgi:hydrophobe/amphiphile efflux-1 (HAE1) family protein
LRDVLVFTDTFLLDQLRFIENIGDVDIGGFSERNLRIWPDLKKLKKADLTVLDIVDAIQNQHVEAAAGQYVEKDRELRVRWLGEAYDVDTFKNLRILTRGGATIQDAVYRIGDVAEVEDGLSDIRRVASLNGRTAVGIAVRKQRGSNEVELAAAVQKKLDELKDQLPEGYSVRITVNFTEPTKAVVHTTIEKLVVAALVTIVICFLFLGGWQAGLNILFSIPTSIVGTFLFVYFMGFTLNLFSLLALTLAISIVVDDAIMLLENIVRHQRMGKNPYKAAFDGAMEILPAATAATFAVVAVFLPVIFMEGVTGKFFFQFGVTMSVAVLLSLVEAVTITPMRAAALMSTSPKISKFEHRLDDLFHGVAERYRRILAKVLNHHKIVVVVSIALFALSMFLVRKVRQEFVPMQDQNFLIVQGQTPPGTSLEATAKAAHKIEEITRANPNVEGYLMSVGAGGPSSAVNAFFMPINLKPRETRADNHVAVMQQLREQYQKVSGVRVTLRDISSRGLTAGRTYPVSFNLRGADLEILRKGADEIMKQMSDEGLALDLDTDFKVGIPELEITPLRDKMAARGVSVESVANTLNVAVAGIRQSRFTAGGRRYDIRVKVPEDQIKTKADIERIQVRNQWGNMVPLSELVSIKEDKTIQSITRINRQRAVGVFGQLAPGKSQAGVMERARELSLKVLPDGYSFSLEGSSAGLAESFRSLTVALLMGILVAYMILAVQFNSFVHPVSVLIALPFSVTGALIALWGFDISLNMFSFIGLIVLMGIAKKNSILLVEFTNHVRFQKDRKEEVDVTEALLEACPVRLRPILMTSTATVTAALPLIIGNSLGQETRTPMGLTIIGGTLVSTLLTLFVVPCLYKTLSRLELRRKHLEL